MAKLTPELKAGLAQHKPTLLAMLAPPEADVYALEERLAIQGEADAPAGAEAWPDAFTLWTVALALLAGGFPPEVLATLKAAEVEWVVDTTPDSPTDWWAMLSKADREELQSPRKPRQRCRWCGGIAHHAKECLRRPVASGGKYAGLPLANIPERYLAYCVRERFGLGEERRAFLLELQRRFVRYRTSEWEALLLR